MEIRIEVDGTFYNVPMFTKISDAFKKVGITLSLDYNTNPVVGAFFNGQFVCLDYALTTSGVLKPIRVFDPQGRRIYRHSLSYLLCCAASSVCPSRHLVIGHSLGNSFYFSFSDGNPVDDSTIKLIQDEMSRLVENKTVIEYVGLSNIEAKNYFSTCGAKDTELLLSCINEPEVKVYRLGKFMDMVFEPVVPNTGILSKFELRKYHSGMLLRYPVSYSLTEIPKWIDFPGLFSVFAEYKQWGKILEVSCLGDLNRKSAGGEAEQYIRLCETLQQRKISDIAQMIAERDAHAVFIAGPSSSGKTTFAKKLCESLMLMGYEAVRISLDDYYKQRTDIPKDENGEIDYECLEALRVNQFHENMRDMFEGKEVFLPQWSFSEQNQTFRTKGEKLTEKTVFVIEGIHGLNPKITDCVDPKSVFRIYISALTQLNIDDHNRVSTTDNRIIRRIIRDNRTRGVSASETLNMWPSVERGERLHIFPYQNNADVMFNSALDYELGVLSPYVTPLLKAISPEDEEAYSTARRLLAFLENVNAIESGFVPTGSILREFIGGSDYE